MKRINFSEAKAGMVLVQPITDQQGRVIVNAGAKLNQLYISRLEKWGVREICVQDEGNGTAPAPAAEALPSALPAGAPRKARALPPGVYRGPDLQGRIRRTFAKVRDDPLMAALQTSVARRLGEASSGKKP
jgi:hypothetical protein